MALSAIAGAARPTELGYNQMNQALKERVEADPRR
jgi:hypothetical protein